MIMAQGAGPVIFFQLVNLKPTKAYYEGSIAHKTDSRRWLVSRPDAR